MQISEHPGIREALQKDEVGVAVLFEEILKSDTDKTAVLSLKDDSACCFLNLIQMVNFFSVTCRSTELHSDVRFWIKGFLAIKILAVELVVYS
jgi:hypothetical protein